MIGAAVRRRRSRRGTDGAGLESTDRRVIWKSLAVLLDYPEARHEADLALVSAALAELAPSVQAQALRDFVTWWSAMGAIERASVYVATFDMTRRCSLNLTYYTEGDKRDRGSALLLLKERYEGRGAAAVTSELPDHLPMMLEFAASWPDGEDLLTGFASAIATLQLALRDSHSPFRILVETLIDTLPAHQGDRETPHRLREHGPPSAAVRAEAQAVQADAYGEGCR